MQATIILSSDFFTKITPIAQSILVEMEGFSAQRLREDLAFVTNLGSKIKALGEPAKEINYTSLYSCATSLFNRLEPLAFEDDPDNCEIQEIERTLVSLSDGLRILIQDRKEVEFLYLDTLYSDFQENITDDPCFTQITSFHHDKPELVRFLNEAKVVVEKLYYVLETSSMGIDSVLQAEEFLKEIHSIKGTSSFFPELGSNITRFCHEFESILAHWLQMSDRTKYSLPNPMISRVLRIFVLLLENLDGRLNRDSAPHSTLKLDSCYSSFINWKQGKFISPDSILDPRLVPLGTDTLIKLPYTRLDQLVEEVHALQLMVGKVQEKFSDQFPITKSLKPILQGLNRLQTKVLDSRLFPIGLVFDRFLRTIKEHGKTLKKQITCEIRGSEIQIDQNTANILSIPITHLVRNAIDHGIEIPSLRKKRGKSLPGLISLSALQSSNRLLVEICDDGEGVPDQFSKKQSTEELLEGLTRLGYSSKNQITPNSGRGIGLYVAKREIEKHGGSLRLETSKGEFTKFIIEIPLRFFVAECILFHSTGQVFAIPLDHLRKVSLVEESSSITISNEPVRYLSKLVDPRSNGSKEIYELELINGQNKVLKLRVEECLGKDSLLIRSMDSPFLQSLPLTSAASVLPNGQVCWILDPDRILDDGTGRSKNLLVTSTHFTESSDATLKYLFSEANQGRVLCFETNEIDYAIPLYCLKEVLSFENPVRLPILPELILGLISLRGIPIPLVDLTWLLTNTPSLKTPECILILEHKGVLTGVPTGKLKGIQTLQAEDLISTNASTTPLIIGSFDLKNRPIQLLNFEALVIEGINFCNSCNQGAPS